MEMCEDEVISTVRTALARGRHVHMTVKGRSMLPFLREGDVVELAPLAGAPRVGAVVLAQLPDGRYPLHRVVAQRDGAWLVRGDNCGAPDGAVPLASLIGVVTHLERNGRPIRIPLGRMGWSIAWLSAHGWLLPITRGPCSLPYAVRAILRRV